MEVVSGKVGSEKTYYVAPPRDIIEEEMNNFLQWFNTTEESLIKAAIANLWFVVIHPFDDGNGRITRAITDLVLSKIEQSKISKLTLCQVLSMRTEMDTTKHWKEQLDM